MAIVRMTREQARKIHLSKAQRARLDAMTDADITAAARSDPDNPPMTEEEWARARRPGRPPLPPEQRKTLVTVRLDPDVLKYFQSSGPGWQTRVAAILRRAAKLSAAREKRAARRAALRKAAKSRKRA